MMNICINFPLFSLLILTRSQIILGVNVSVTADDTVCVGNNITVTCRIDPFTSPPSATWNRNGAALTTCTSGGICTTDSLIINGIEYSFLGGSNEIKVFLQVQQVEDGIQWNCDHNSITYPYTFEVLNDCKTTDSPETPKTTVIVVVACVVPVIIIVIGIGGLMLYCQKKKRDARKTQADGLVPTGPEEKQKINDQKERKTEAKLGAGLLPTGPEIKQNFNDKKGMPLEPEGPLKIKTRQDHVEFQWKPPKSDGGSEITEYIVEVNGIKFDTWETFAKSSSMKLQVPMEKFKDGKVMSFRVRAENENGLSEPLLAQKPFTLQNSHDLLSNRPVVTNQGRGHDGDSSLLEKVPIDRTLPKPV